MNRRAFMTAVALATIATPVIADSQESRIARQVGFFHIGSPEPFAKLLLAFEERMAELGYRREKDLVIVSRFADGPADLSRVAAELVRLKVDLILVQSNIVCDAARQATVTIPIVTIGVTDPIGNGFIKSLSRPGGNITGVTSDVGMELWAKRLEFLREAVPGASPIALFWNPDQSRVVANFAEEGARKLGIGFYREEFHNVGDFPRAFASMAKRGGAVLVAGHAVTFAGRAEIVKLAAQFRLPTGYPWREAVEIGGLMSYGVNLRESWRRAADYADKILKGAKPADLPVQQPTKFELSINVKTAKALGLTIPPSLLLRADQVLE